MGGGGALALDAAWLFAIFLIIGLFLAAGIGARRFLLERGGGTVECGLRKAAGSWRLGVASYQREELLWFRVFGISMRPEETFPRRDLTVVSRRLPTQPEAASLGPGMVVIECRLARAGEAHPVELALTDAALTGLLSWLEASPPGSHMALLSRTALGARARDRLCPQKAAPPPSRARRPASTGRPRCRRWPGGRG